MNEGGRFIKILLNFLKTFYSAAIKRTFFEEKSFFAAPLGVGGSFPSAMVSEAQFFKFFRRNDEKI